MNRRRVFSSMIALAVVCTGWLLWFIDARVDSYYRSTGDPDVAMLINACVWTSDSDWQLPYCQSGTAAFGLYANDCRAGHIRSLFFVENHFSCTWLEKHESELIFRGERPLIDGGAEYAMLDLVNRHAWCQDPPPSCTTKETRDLPNWCLPEPAECAEVQIRSIDWILEHNADSVLRKSEISEALFQAVGDENVLAVEALLERGGDPEFVEDTGNGVSALDIAHRNVNSYRSGDPPDEVFLQYSANARKVLSLIEER